MHKNDGRRMEIEIPGAQTKGKRHDDETGVLDEAKYMLSQMTTINFGKNTEH